MISNRKVVAFWAGGLDVHDGLMRECSALNLVVRRTKVSITNTRSRWLSTNRFDDHEHRHGNNVPASEIVVAGVWT